MSCLKVKITATEPMRIQINPTCEMGLGFIQLFCKDGALLASLRGVAQKIFVKK